MKTHRLLYAILPAVLFMAGFCACGKQEYRTAEGMVWNTEYHITYKSDAELSDSVISELKRVEMSVSAFNPNSIVSKINRNESAVLDAYFCQVYNTAVDVCRESGGAFDPTLAPLINFYGFGYEKAVYDADTTRVAEIMKHIGIEKTSVKGTTLIKTDPGIEFNFSALAKGYGCDCVASLFERNGADNYLIEIGGEIRLKGKNPKGEDWRISIDRPIFSNDNEIHDSQMVVALSDCGVATSGNYRNYKIVDGKRVVHTIDRFTGKPAINDLLSVTVIVPDRQASKTMASAATPCMLADAYATACMSMGSAKAKAMIKRLDLAAMFILSDGTIWQSQRFPDPEQ